MGCAPTTPASLLFLTLLGLKMPELPEVETIRRDLESRLVGRTIIALRVPPDQGRPVTGIKGMDEAAFRDGVVGASFEGTSRRWTYLVFELVAALLVVVT